MYNFFGKRSDGSTDNASAQDLNVMLTHLRERYDTSLKSISQLVNEKNNEILRATLPLYYEKRFLKWQYLFTLQQQEILANYLKNPQQQDETKLNENYQQRLNETIEDILRGYREEIQEKEQIYLNGEIKEINTADLKKAEVERQRQNIERDLLPAFRGFYFNLQADLITLQKQFDQQIKLLEEEFNKKFDEYNEVLMEQLNSYQKLCDSLQVERSVLQQQRQALSELQTHLMPWEQLCMSGNVEALKAQLSYRNKQQCCELLKQNAPNALHFACRFGQITMVQYLLYLGIDLYAPDTNGYYPFHHAAMGYDATKTQTVFNLLDQYHADFKLEGPYGRTLIHTASLFGSKETIMWFREHQPKIFNKLLNQPEKGRLQKNTPLHNAAYGGHPNIIHQLLSAGANPLMLNYEGHTPLMEIFYSSKTSCEEKCTLYQTFIQSGAILSEQHFLTLQKRPDFNAHILEGIRYTAARLKGCDQLLQSYLDRFVGDIQLGNPQENLKGLKSMTPNLQVGLDELEKEKNDSYQCSM